MISSIYEKLKNSQTISDKLIEQITEPQNNYRIFFDKLMQKSELKESYSSHLQKTYDYELNDVKISFNLFNTSWISRRGNDAGKLLFPLEALKFQEKANDSYRISLMHHNFNWFDPNNSRIFKEQLEINSNLIFTGHEHTNKVEKRTNIDEVANFEVEHIEGGVLQDVHKEDNSSFCFIQLNFIEKEREIKYFKWEKEKCMYLPSSSIITALFETKKKTKYRLKENIRKYLEDPGFNLQHPRKEKITLQDIFIKPDLTLIKVEKDETEEKVIKFSDFLNMNEELTKEVNFVLGEEKTGKTSLLKMLFLNFHEKKKYPLLVNGEDIKSKKFEKVIEEAYNMQFENSLCYNIFSQEDRNDKILLIDDFHKVKDKQQELFIEKASKYFGICIFSINSVFELELFFTKEIAYNRIRLEDFNEENRFLLVNNWERLENNNSEREIVNKVHQTKNTLDISISNNITPSRPMFLITSLLTFESNNTLKLEESSRGYYYEFLIIQSISKITTENDEIVGFFTFLSNLAYYFYENNSLEFDKVAKFHREFIEENDIAPSFRKLYDFNTLMDSLVEVSLMSVKSNEYKFKYNYIYYYFISKYFSDNLTRKDIRKIVVELSDKMYLESNGNIILFLTHHSKDPFIIDEIIKRADELFKNEIPIQFKEDITHLNELISALPQFQINEEEDYHRNRIEQYRMNDNQQQQTLRKKEKIEDLEERKIGVQFNLAFKTIEIIGNILKNHHSSLNGPRKREILKVAFGLGFRTNKFIFSIFGEDIETQLVRLTKNKFESTELTLKSESLKYAKNVTFQFTNMISFFILINMGQSLGHKKLSVTYEKLEEKDLKSNATSLLNLIMKLEYSNSFPLNDITKIYKKLESNKFSLNLLRSIVIRQIRLFPIKREEKQAVCSLLDISIKRENLLDIKKEEMRSIV